MNNDDKMVWDKLLSGKRERGSTTTYEGEKWFDHRDDFDKDFDRIVYSSSVRRLQDKAQVFPLQENDFTRTRLTHSLEASALARSFGYAIGEWLLHEGHIESEKDQRKLSTMLQVAALIHDLGNPPFGHYGESIIRSWFKKWFVSDEFKELNENYKQKHGGIAIISEAEKKDLIYFEGNAQTLRIVTKLQMLNDAYGANFTYGTLATIIKYPWNSSSDKAKSKGKFGYFMAEEALVKKIFNETGISEGKKHPATYLLEAADDIAYLTADIEDSVKKGILPWYKEYDIIKAKLGSKDLYKDFFKDLDRISAESKDNKIPNDDMIAIQNFKIKTQGLMFRCAIKSFIENYDAIITGKYTEDLIKHDDCKDIVKELKRLAGEYCFSNKEVISLELVGDNVITGLLDRFVTTIVNCEDPHNKKIYAGKMYSLFSENFTYICRLDDNGQLREFKDTSLYEKLLLITDYISGMTDSYAVNLYNKLLGVKLP